MSFDTNQHLSFVSKVDWIYSDIQDGIYSPYNDYFQNQTILWTNQYQFQYFGQNNSKVKRIIDYQNHELFIINYPKPKATNSIRKSQITAIQKRLKELIQQNNERIDIGVRDLRIQLAIQRETRNAITMNENIIIENGINNTNINDTMDIHINQSGTSIITSVNDTINNDEISLQNNMNMNSIIDNEIDMDIEMKTDTQSIPTITTSDLHSELNNFDLNEYNNNTQIDPCLELAINDLQQTSMNLHNEMEETVNTNNNNNCNEIEMKMETVEMDNICVNSLQLLCEYLNETIGNDINQFILVDNMEIRKERKLLSKLKAIKEGNFIRISKQNNNNGKWLVGLNQQSFEIKKLEFYGYNETKYDDVTNIYKPNYKYIMLYESQTKSANKILIIDNCIPLSNDYNIVSMWWYNTKT